MKRVKVLPIAVIAALLPLAFCFHIETIDLSKYPWFPNRGYWLDFFLYGKSLLLQAMAGMMAILLIASVMKKKKVSFQWEGGLLAVLGGFLLLSAIGSQFPKESFCGSIEQYETIGVLFSYMILGIYCCHYAKTGKNIQDISDALVFGLMISCILGVLQIFQLDLWDSTWGKKLLIPEAYAQLRESLRFAEDTRGFGRVYLSQYNANYAGIYILMLLPLLVLSKKKIWKVFLVPAVLCLVGTMSRTVWIAAVLLVILGLWMKSPAEWKNRIKKRWIVGGCVVFAAGAVLLVSLPVFNNVVSGEKKLMEISGESDHIRIVFKGNKLYFSEFPKNDSVTYRIVDESGREPNLIWVEERGEIDSLDPRFQELHFRVYKKDNIGYAAVRYENVIFRFTDDLGTGKYEYVTINGKVDEPEIAETFFDVGDSFLNGRGYIWNRVIPLIADHFLLGTGPETFLQVFPQDDYVARANLGYGFFSELLTNAHSLYFQTALQNGMVVVICAMILLGIYLKRSWKYYAHRPLEDELDRIGAGAFLGSIGYLICGLTFASSVCTTPIFLILVGLSAGLRKRGEKMHKNGTEPTR